MNSHQRRIEKRRADQFARSPNGSKLIRTLDDFERMCANLRGNLPMRLPLTRLPPRVVRVTSKEQFVALYGQPATVDMLVQASMNGVPMPRSIEELRVNNKHT